MILRSTKNKWNELMHDYVCGKIVNSGQQC